MEEEQHTSIPFHGRRLSSEGKYGICFNLISTACHLRRYRFHTKAFNPVFQYGAGIVMDSFWVKTRKERRLWHKCAGLSHVWDIQLQQRHVLGEIILPLTVAGIHSSFTSLSPSFDLLLSSSLTLPFAPLQFLLYPPATSRPVVIMDEI